MAAAEIVRQRFAAFRQLRRRLLDTADTLGDPTLAQAVTTHVDDLDQCVQASWVWQWATARYKQGRSIFAEAWWG
ncbi:hypothetical protein [Nocardia africana]|uniref:Uncharacterized protein n=1 Tax=Nocardia africana TaxID=134964 RepID=A0ABW6NUZ9_9NOCA